MLRIIISKKFKKVITPSEVEEQIYLFLPIESRDNPDRIDICNACNKSWNGLAQYVNGVSVCFDKYNRELKENEEMFTITNTIFEEEQAAIENVSSFIRSLK